MGPPHTISDLMVKTTFRRLFPVATEDGPSNRQEASEGFLSGIAVQFLILVTGILAARILGEEGRGQQALIWIVALTVAQVGMFGLPLAITYESAKGTASFDRLLAHIRPLVVIQAAAIVLVYAVVALLLLHDRIPWEAAAITLFALPAMVWQAYGLALIQGRRSFRALHVLRILPAALYVVSLTVGVLLGGGSLLLVMGCWSMSYVVAAVATSAYIRRMDGEPLSSELDELPEVGKLARFGASGFLGSSSPTETFKVDQLMVGLLLSTSDLALYVTALAFCNLPRLLTQAQGLVAYAHVAAEHDPAEQHRLMIRHTIGGTAIAAVVSGILALLAGPLIDLTFGPDFSEATVITQILLGGTVLLCARRMLSECMRGTGAPGAGSIAEIVSLVALVPAFLIFVPPFGLEGFALGMVVSYLAGFIVLLRSAVRFARRDSSETR